MKLFATRPSQEGRQLGRRRLRMRVDCRQQCGSERDDDVSYDLQIRVYDSEQTYDEQQLPNAKPLPASRRRSRVCRGRA